jgi:hypothetical protein
LQGGCAWDVTLRRFIPGSPALEAALHRILRPWRMRGEWFQPTEFIASLAHGVPAPETGAVA